MPLTTDSLVSIEFCANCADVEHGYKRKCLFEATHYKRISYGKINEMVANYLTNVDGDIDENDEKVCKWFLDTKLKGARCIRFPNGQVQLIVYDDTQELQLYVDPQHFRSTYQVRFTLKNLRGRWHARLEDTDASGT